MPNVNTWSACEEEIGTSYQPPASARAPWYACVTSTLSSPFSDMVQGQPESDALGCRLSKPCVSAAKSRQVVMLKAPEGQEVRASRGHAIRDPRWQSIRGRGRGAWGGGPLGLLRWASRQMDASGTVPCNAPSSLLQKSKLEEGQ